MAEPAGCSRACLLTVVLEVSISDVKRVTILWTEVPLRSRISNLNSPRVKDHLGILSKIEVLKIHPPTSPKFGFRIPETESKKAKKLLGWL